MNVIMCSPRTKVYAWIIIPFSDTKRTMEYTQHDDPYSLVSHDGLGQLENLFI